MGAGRGGPVASSQSPAAATASVAPGPPGTTTPPPEPRPAGAGCGGVSAPTSGAPAPAAAVASIVVPGPPSCRGPPPACARPRRWPGRPTELAAGSGPRPCRLRAAACLHGAGQAPAADAVPGRPPPMSSRPAGTGGVGDASTAPSESARAAAVAGSAAPANVVAPGPVGVFATPHPSLCAPRPRSPSLVTA